MGKHFVYKLRGIPEMSPEEYHYFLGLRDGREQLFDIVDKCTTSDQMETVFRYIEERIRMATFYEESWGDTVRAHYDKQEFGSEYRDACTLRDYWSSELHLFSQVRNFMVKVCGVDQYGIWIKENHDE
jgi:hypothetical protein